MGLAHAALIGFITVASTTSTEQSGLFKHLLPAFEKKTGIQVRVVALGTGQALDMGKRGDADVVFVHARALEEKFVAEGYGVKRFEVMYNDFVLVGPKSDPAGVGGGKDIVVALKKISQSKAAFASRGDTSGTHFAELQLWTAAGIDIASEKGPWYRDTGSGMSEEQRTRLFQPFRSFFGHGTGIGMAIVYRIVHEHGGRIEVDSQLGAGTRIRVELPVGANSAVPLAVGL